MNLTWRCCKPPPEPVTLLGLLLLNSPGPPTQRPLGLPLHTTHPCGKY